MPESFKDLFYWRKYPINKDSIIEDVKQQYLSSGNAQNNITPFQELVERIVSGGSIIEGRDMQNKKSTYEEQFYEGHASKGGRIIEVASHIGKKGHNKGKLMHFNKPANDRYLWVVDEYGNFIAGNRHTFLHDMENMDKNEIDYEHRLHKLPHSTLARGRAVYGTGEVLVMGGLVHEVNTYSGHYVPILITPGTIPYANGISLIEEFNLQGIIVFRYYKEIVGWKETSKGASYRL